jgi:hypothetical protein
MENKETKTESRGNRIRGCGAGGRVGAAGHADLCHRSAGGLRDSSGRPCIWGKSVSRGTTRGARYSEIRSHLWACKASSSSSCDSDSLSSSGMIHIVRGAVPLFDAALRVVVYIRVGRQSPHRAHALPVVCNVYTAAGNGTSATILTLVRRHYWP